MQSNNQIGDDVKLAEQLFSHTFDNISVCHEMSLCGSVDFNLFCLMSFSVREDVNACMNEQNHTIFFVHLTFFSCVNKSFGMNKPDYQRDREMVCRVNNRF